MAPSKGNKKELKPENGSNSLKIDDPINTDSWKCVVAMIVEKTSDDSFVVKDFIEESNGRRQEVSVIDYSFVVKLLYEFENGGFSYEYAFLLNFSSVFQEAINYINNKMEIPMFVLAKLVKAMLFYLREESLIRFKKAEAGLPDPIKAMAERPLNFETPGDAKMKGMIKKGDKVRPPSVVKQDTYLLKRNEKAKDNQRIDDAPRNGYFSLYVILTGFYEPDFPVELIKTGIPLHALVCVDTSYAGVKDEIHIQSFDVKYLEIQNFWKAFLKILWDPKVMFHFRDIIFQMYIPRSLRCERKKLREFIYREISYLMYDLSDLKHQLSNYLEHLRLRDVTEKDFDMAGTLLEFGNLPNECVTVPTVLQSIIDAICANNEKHQLISSSTDFSAREESDQLEQRTISSITEPETFGEEPTWSQKLDERKDFNLLNVYFKIKELDLKYDLNDKSFFCTNSENSFVETESSKVTCDCPLTVTIENKGEDLLPSDGIFRSYWEKYPKNLEPVCNVDYCLYSLFMTKVVCPYQTPVTSQASPADSYNSCKKNSFFELIENLSEEMRKPHFTVTDGSRNILKSIPYNYKNTPRNFFCPQEYKIVSPEKLKASSAPEFRVTPKTQMPSLFMSEALISFQTQGTPFNALRGFIDECLFSNTDDFDLVEILSKPKLLEKEYKHWDSYNCIDHSYFILNDCILIMLHNRKDKDNVNHETFNETLKTTVGLRDFYEYVMEDESEWLKDQEQLVKSTEDDSDKTLTNNDPSRFTESDFWMADSIKFTNFRKNSEKPTEGRKTSRYPRKVTISSSIDKLKDMAPPPKVFEGYDVSDTTVQFSGLKTVYYANDCSVTVQLIERLYGNQELGIHVATPSHTLHLYSYVCPEPHVLDPFTFHLTYKNGIVMAFERRFVEAFDEVEEIIESRTLIKGKKNSSDVSTRIIKRLIPKLVKDEEFVYNMAASFPNGLSIRTVRNVVKLCYIKQYYRVDSYDSVRAETSRLFLPNGNLVKMMRNGTVEILKTNATIVTASLNDLIDDYETGNVNFTKFEIISGEGYAQTFEEGEVISSKRLQVFQNTDLETGQVFFRRRDGTNYLLQGDGTHIVQFKDGTKMSSSVLEATTPDETQAKRESGFASEEDIFGETDFDSDYVTVDVKITFEHPDYATVTYDTKTRLWNVLLPYESSITVKPNGHYSVVVDSQTELMTENDCIQMKNFSWDRELVSTFTADLSVFESKEESVYCHMVSSTGRTFIVEENSNCYILKGEETPQQGDTSENTATEVRSRESDVSEFVASADLQICLPIKMEKSKRLSREDKYFVIKRDITGLELLHVDDVREELKRSPKGCLVYTQNIPNTEHRCFVLISPKPKNRPQKWAVDTILPNPKYEPSAKKAISSSTYGDPPSWMHPFPRRKIKFVIPQSLTCRVFVETKRTNLSPQVGALDCYNCELSEMNEVKYTQIPENGVEEYFKKLSNDDQDILREMYTLAAGLLINEKKRLKPINSEKLKHYLEMSKYFVELREYHKKSIRYHTVPNYFHHPAGMSWLILNELIDKLELPFTVPLNAALNSDKMAAAAASPSSKSESLFSYEEIEYNLSLSSWQSFSDLSCHSDLTAQSAPAEMRTEGICRCKVKATKSITSFPVIKVCWVQQVKWEKSSITETQSRICDFREEDIEMMKKTEYVTKEMAPMTLEDLMYLGLI